MSSAATGDVLHILLVFKNTDVLTWLPPILTDVGHTVMGLCTGLKEYRQQLAIPLSPFPDLIITNYTAPDTLKNMQGVVRSRGGVAPFILVGRTDEDTSILNGPAEPYIFGRELPSKFRSPLQVQATIMSVMKAFRTVYALEQRQAAIQRREREAIEYEQALDVLMEYKPHECPTRIEANRILTKMVTSRRRKRVVFIRQIIQAGETLKTVPDK